MNFTTETPASTPRVEFVSTKSYPWNVDAGWVTTLLANAVRDGHVASLKGWTIRL